MKGYGEKCSLCEKTPLILVNGALACPKCDCTELWPAVRRAKG